jgi:hypothetical protein
MQKVKTKFLNQQAAERKAAAGFGDFGAAACLLVRGQQQVAL